MSLAYYSHFFMISLWHFDLSLSPQELEADIFKVAAEIGDLERKRDSLIDHKAEVEQRIKELQGSG